MSYQVLARKWRPRLFREMVGQEHVLKALINALDHNRLHHAYLFTGTRGVGKTTIARILAKCLNCEVGVSSEPCDQCSSCTEINEGRFVDLIEVDAASRTKVEDTRELLENVQYAPTRGRYKVYLIDEVHMLSNSSFNALLKTLEEPPPHVKFLLATTDPHKLPVTVLSRCLQFSLKNMSAERIVDHLETILKKEMVPFEEAGLWQLGRAADGSMRDALSLTDQAISFSNGKVTELDVRSMLGTIDQSLVQNVLKGLVDENGPAILSAVAQMAEHAPDYSSVLAELIAMLHRIAIAQMLPEAIDNSLGDRQQVYDFAQAMASEDVQLYYQTALLGRRDLPLSPDPRGGFEMVMLRMLAFKPQGLAELPSKPLPKTNRVEPSATEKKPSATEKPSASEVSSVPEDTSHLTAEAPQQREASDPVKKPEAASVNVSQNVSQLQEVLQRDEVPQPDEVPQREEAPQPENLTQSSPIAPQETCAHKAVVDNTSVNEVAAQVALESVTQGSLTQESVTQEPVTLEQVAPQHSVNEAVHTANADNAHSSLNHQQKESAEAPEKRVALNAFNSEQWLSVYQQLAVGGLLQSTVANCAYDQIQEDRLTFTLDEQQSTLYDTSHQQRLADLLSDYFERSLEVEIKLGVPQSETPSQIILRRQKERQLQAEAAIHADPVVQQLQETFGAVIVDDSIKPID